MTFIPNSAISAPAAQITGTTLAANVVNSSLTSVGTLSSLTVTGGETAVTVGTQKWGTIAQVTVLAAGTDLFTPTTDCTYILRIRVQDVATGTPANETTDIVTLTATGVWAPTKMVASVTNLGTCATTYTKNGSALRLAVGSGVTWYADIEVLRFPA